MFKKIQIVYLIGIGGIGMSALAKYFLLHNKKVYGYDLNISDNTKTLEQLGAIIHYNDEPQVIKELINKNNIENILIIYTPAIPQTSNILKWLNEKNIRIFKRSEILGEICNNYKYTIAVAGTHGKTTTSSLLAHILNNSTHLCCAFLGGILKNYNSNFIFNENTDYIVVEADEYDRSFLHLNSYASIITAVDPDHLDIYGNYENLKDAFQQFTNKIKPNGKLLIKKPIAFTPKIDENIHMLTYSIKNINADCYINNVSIINGFYKFDIITPFETINDIQPKILGLHNLENILAAASMALWLGVNKNVIKSAIENFSGIKRRFDVQINNNHFTLIDDYAHHPEEIKATISSIKELFPSKKMTIIFQPHLYSRTKDLATEFAEALNLADEICLLPIYPAREEKIEGVTSKLIYDKIKNSNKHLIEENQLLNYIKSKKPELIITMGAGDVNKFIEPIKNILNEN
jgi:UDP-N-acetylmuramate--alanine ligase